MTTKSTSPESKESTNQESNISDVKYVSKETISNENTNSLVHGDSNNNSENAENSQTLAHNVSNESIEMNDGAYHASLSERNGINLEQNKHVVNNKINLKVKESHSTLSPTSAPFHPTQSLHFVNHSNHSNHSNHAGHVNHSSHGSYNTNHSNHHDSNSKGNHGYYAPQAPNLLLFTFDAEHFFLSSVHPEEIEILDERKIERNNLQELIRILTLEPEYKNSNIVVDENAYVDFIQNNTVPSFFHKYHSLQKAFTVHLVTLSKYNENINRDHLNDEWSEKQTSKLESKNHKDLLLFMLTILRQGFKFLKPTLLKELKKSIQNEIATNNVSFEVNQSESITNTTTNTSNTTTTEEDKDSDPSGATKEKKETNAADYQISKESVLASLPPDTTVLRLRGLPWTATASEVEKFFEDAIKIENPSNDILIVLNFHGRATGEAYVKFGSFEDAQAAICKDRAVMGHRYIELFPASIEEMEKSRSIMERELLELGNSCVVRMRGLPQGTLEDEIRKFFEGLDNKIVNVLLIPKETSKGPGGAYVEFDSTEVVEEALKRNKEKIGTRYIELFRSTKAEMIAADRFLKDLEQFKSENSERNKLNSKKFKGGKKKVQNTKKQPVQSKGVSYGFDIYNSKYPNTSVRLRGLPFKADEVDISEFFGNLKIAEQGIHFVYNASDGKKTGEAYVEFQSIEDKMAALEMDHRMMGDRYIEIFPGTKSRRHAMHSSNLGTAQSNMMMNGSYFNPQYLAFQNYFAYMAQMSMLHNSNIEKINPEQKEDSNEESKSKPKKLNANATEFNPDPNFHQAYFPWNAMLNFYNQQMMQFGYPAIPESVEVDASDPNLSINDLTEEASDSNSETGVESIPVETPVN